MCLSTLPRRCWAEIDGKALRHNIRRLRAHVSPTTQILAPVKANAYGHGIVPIALELAQTGVEWLGTASVTEAVQLREAGITIPILMLGAALREEMDAAVRMGIHLTLSSTREAQWLNETAAKVGPDALGYAHLKVDTGMGRLGVWHQDTALELNDIRKLPQVRVAGVMTHFASSDTDPELTHQQWSHFLQQTADIKTRPTHITAPQILVHASNSGAIVNGIGTSLDLIRPGIVMYGAYGDIPWAEDHWTTTELQRVLTWKSRVTLLRDVPAGRTLSYGATYTVPETQRIATVSAGYGDGYHRRASNCAQVLIGGKRCPIRGRVTMDQILVDVSAVQGVTEGDEVVLVGRQGTEEISAADVAGWAETISYEVLTSISPRVPRVYLDFESQKSDISCKLTTTYTSESNGNATASANSAHRNGHSYAPASHDVAANRQNAPAPDSHIALGKN